MTGAGDDGDVVVGHVVLLVEVVGHEHVVLGYDTLDGGHHKLVLHLGLHLLEVCLEVGRGGDEHKHVAILDHLVDV